MSGFEMGSAAPLQFGCIFIRGLRKDWDAVSAAFTIEWSNGMVEGQVNRLKLLKRQMYGRANFDLLRLWVFHHDEVSHTKCA